MLSKYKLKFKTKPWITTALQKSISIKNKLFIDYIDKKYLSQKTELHIKYKSYRNMSSTLMKKSKQNYFTKFFENNLKNLTNTWKGIKSIISLKSSFSNNLIMVVSKDLCCPTLLAINHHAVRRFICFSTIINQHEFHLQSIF